MLNQVLKEHLIHTDASTLNPQPLNQVLREDLTQTNGMLVPSGELHRGAILRYESAFGSYREADMLWSQPLAATKMRPSGSSQGG